MAIGRSIQLNLVRWRQWFALLGGALAWTSHLLGAYVISEFGCVAGWGEHEYLGWTPVAWLILLASGLAAAVAAAATWTAYHIGNGDPQGDLQKESQQFVARAGLITSGMFTLIILVESIPIFYYLQKC